MSPNNNDDDDADADRGCNGILGRCSTGAATAATAATATASTGAFICQSAAVAPGLASWLSD